MTTLGVTCLIAVFVFTAFISVVTGGTSLITVPVMLQLGLDPHVAVATNIFTLIFLSLGGTTPFLKGQFTPRKRLPALVGITISGSILGALLLIIVPGKAMPLIVAAAMMVVAVFTLINRNAGLVRDFDGPSPISELTGYSLTFLLGIYGGFFSGGYVALLTAAFVTFIKMTFIEAVAITNLLNIFSSTAATVIFASQSLIDWRLGVVLAPAAFTGAMAGAVLARNMSNALLRRVFLVAVVALAVKTVVSDVLR
jgi:uncharacterized protein